MSQKRSPFDGFFDMMDEALDKMEPFLGDEEGKDKKDDKEKRSDGVPDTQRERSDDDTPPLRNPQSPVRPKLPKIIDID